MMAEPASSSMEEKGTGRVEAFSDGVFAIAITLLVLEFRVPELEASARGRDLVATLLRSWPSLLAFLFSFFKILVMWINHHELMRWVRGCDYPFFFANGFVLLLVTFVPFPTALVARYLDTEAARGAVAIYCGTFLLVGLAFGALLRSVARGRRLLRPEVTDDVVEKVHRAYRLGPIVYGTATALVFWLPLVGLLLCASLWILWSRLCYRPAAAGAP